MKSNKNLWNDEDFDNMNWHDCKVYGIGFDDDKYKLIFDIDYILDWVKSEKDNIYFKFWVAPSTLVFENVYELNIDLSIFNGFEICKVCRSEPMEPRNKEYINRNIEWSWHISSNQGDITFKSVGYTQFIRRKPILTDDQSLGLTTRGGISFNEECYTEL